MNYSKKHLELAMQKRDSDLVTFNIVTINLAWSLQKFASKMASATKVHDKEMYTMCIERINLRLTKHLNSLDKL